MLYEKQRALYYHFLMQEIGEVGSGSWKFVAGYFGLNPEEIREYEKALSNPVLAELSTIDDVDMYRNYLHGFLCEENEFGKTEVEQEAIEAKALALHKMLSLFGESSIKSNRLRALSHNYEKDHIASVLYALQILYLNDGSESKSFADNFEDIVEYKHWYFGHFYIDARISNKYTALMHEVVRIDAYKEK